MHAVVCAGGDKDSFADYTPPEAEETYNLLYSFTYAPCAFLEFKIVELHKYCDRVVGLCYSFRRLAGVAVGSPDVCSMCCFVQLGLAASLFKDT
mmetsp:Transcript_8946/g.14218  ORF Transcript_8946/g.14218 Transcript_8946/m.14218 type:complete len:94 (+) Transcript_8946:1150-1431(+)